ncbi:nitric oxide reductase activation protein NorD [Marinomonas sp. NPDC078689]|uniref:nitric oxide reductase activation protein NorD n=1 Tax=Marinomonas sp. NPDC078689 TaxID=3364147 RepID=UPI0037C56F6D
MIERSDTSETLSLSQVTNIEKPEYSEHDKALWLDACYKIEEAGYGATVSQAFAINSSDILQRLGLDSVLKLADMVSLAAIKADKKTAERLSIECLKITIRFDNDTSLANTWLTLMEQVIKLAPESAFLVLNRMDYLLSHLSLSHLEGWLLTGLRAGASDPKKRLSYFSFEDSQAQKWLEHAAGSMSFSDISRETKAYLGALWNIHLPVREKHIHASGERVRRSGFGLGLITVPSSFPGYQGDIAHQLYRAALAHIGAHITYSGTSFSVDQLKPLQIALISLIEDARVEHLAIQDFPGLQDLWKPFHIAKARGAQTANHLFVRLARALADPNYDDTNPWVCKAKQLFYDHKDEWHDSFISRKIGGLLANDLGQMRIQFNAKTYVVDPPYRDDNMGLWDVEDQDTSESTQADELLSNVDIDEMDNSEPDTREETNEIDENNATPFSLLEEDGIPVARYHEYDYMTEQSRPEWTTIVEHSPILGPAHLIDDILQKQAYMVNRIKSLMSSTKISQPQKVRRQLEGEFLDIDACITATISRRSGEEVDARVYARSERKHRDLSIQVLIDVSESTNDKVVDSNECVLEIERQATALLAHAISGLGDPFAIGAFSSNKRDDVHYYRIKDFHKPYDHLAKARLAGLQASGSTRMGAAIRHAAQDLKKQHSHRRLLLVVTDGEPADIDVSDPHYLIEDARRAIHELALDGINVLCVGLDSGVSHDLTRIFGKRNLVMIDSLERLPEKLPSLYFRLTT